MHTGFKATAILSMFMASAPALASPNASGGTQISARIPPVCDLSADNFVLTESGSLSGFVQEFCNTSTAYQVMASYRPLDLSEAATVRYGSRIVELDTSGLVTVAFRSGQRLEDVPVTIDAPKLAAPLAVAFTLSTV